MTTLPALSFGLPTHDRKFQRLPEAARALVIARLGAMQRLAYAGGSSASPSKEEVIKQLCAAAGGKRGWKRGTLVNLWYAFKASGGDWRVLVDRAQAGPSWWAGSSGSLPQEFLEFLCSELCMHQRGKFNSAYVRLIGRLKAWRADAASVQNQNQGSGFAIPGYEFPPENAPYEDHPPGWSKRNLREAAKKGSKCLDYARKLIQIGSKAASALAPKTPKTREGMEVGEYYIADDSWNDFRVLFGGNACRILSLHWLDWASGCNLLRGHKPAVKDEREVEQRLKEADMIFLTEALLSTIGFRAAGTTLIMEKGTATLREREQSMLAQITDGKIDVQCGPMGGGTGIAGQFNGRGGGNPRWKAPLESWFNLLRNRTDHMLEFPGQTGSMQRVNGPEGLAKLEALDEAVWRAAQALPPERAALVKFNLLPYTEAVRGLDAIVDVINLRRDHDLNNWRDCGNIVPAFRLHAQAPLVPAQYIPRLAPEIQAKLAALLQAHPELAGEVALSPREVFAAGSSALKKFTLAESALFLAGIEGREPIVRGGVLEVECPEIDQDKPVVYGPIIRDGNGGEEPLQNGEKWLVRPNPYTPGRVHLYDAKGGWRGMARRRVGAHPGDVEGLRRNWAEASQAEAAWTKEAQKLAAPVTRRATAIAQNNAAVFGKQSKQEIDWAAAAEDALSRGAESANP